MGITPHGFTKGLRGGADAPPAAVPPTREASAQRTVDAASPDGPRPRMRQSQSDRHKVNMMDVFGLKPPFPVVGTNVSFQGEPTLFDQTGGGSI